VAGVPGPPDDSGAPMYFSITDVRCRAGASPCGPPNTSGGDDYTGELLVDVPSRITDKYNDVTPGGGSDPATVTDLSFQFKAVCSSTSASVGSTCAVITHANAVVPGIAKDTKRMVWDWEAVRVLDGGPDGDADTAAGNELFPTQGIFVP
jgi:hypothetical protein